MIKINLQFFGGSGSRLGGSTVNTSSTPRISASSVEVRTSEYQWAHGTPRGNGTWAFRIGDEEVFISGKYSDAKKEAQRRAAELGTRSISLLT